MSTSIVTNGNAVNGNLKDEGDNTEYKFRLPADEEGIVYQCHLCSFTATTRAAFNTHVNTHYDFQCVKCDFEVKVSVSVSTIYQCCQIIKTVSTGHVGVWLLALSYLIILQGEIAYCRHLKEEHNCTPEDLEEAEVRSCFVFTRYNWHDE